MGGGGWRGSMRTTLLSTLGGGRKLFLPTCAGGQRGAKAWACEQPCTRRATVARGKGGSCRQQPAPRHARTHTVHMPARAPVPPCLLPSPYMM